MKELIKITKNEEGQQLVGARELHEFLEVTERFSNWFNRQLQYGFVENEDFTGCKVFNALAKQELQDYAITIDMAKEISMIQRTEKGKQARKYFIKCEEKLREELQNKKRFELTREGNIPLEIREMFCIVPDSNKADMMIKIVDKFYPTGNSKPIKEAKPKSKLPIGLTLDKVVDILRQAYNEAFMAVRSNYIVFNKEITYKYSSYNGIGKREFNKFLLENNLVKIEKSSSSVTCTCSINKKKIKALYIKAEIFNN